MMRLLAKGIVIKKWQRSNYRIRLRFRIWIPKVDYDIVSQFTWTNNQKVFGKPIIYVCLIERFNTEMPGMKLDLHKLYPEKWKYSVIIRLSKCARLLWSLLKDCDTKMVHKIQNILLILKYICWKPIILLFRIFKDKSF